MPAENEIEDFEEEIEEEEEESEEEPEEEESEEEESEEEESEEEEEEAPAPKKGRAQNRIQTLKAENLRKEQELTELRTQQAAISAQLQTFQNFGKQQSQAEQDAAETAKVAKMSEVDRVAYFSNKANTQLQTQMMNLQFKMHDSADRSAFEAKAATDPVRKRFAPQVEEELKKFWAAGQTAPRENILAYLIGQEVLNKGGDTSSRKKAAARRMDAASPRPPASRGDAGRTRKGKSLEQRLEGVSI